MKYLTSVLLLNFYIINQATAMEPEEPTDPQIVRLQELTAKGDFKALNEFFSETYKKQHPCMYEDDSPTVEDNSFFSSITQFITGRTRQTSLKTIKPASPSSSSSTNNKPQ